jgi:hypothetical protein
MHIMRNIKVDLDRYIDLRATLKDLRDSYINLSHTRHDILNTTGENLSSHLGTQVKLKNSKRHDNLFKVKCKYGTFHTSSASLQILMDATRDQAITVIKSMVSMTQYKDSLGVSVGVGVVLPYVGNIDTGSAV